MRGIGLHFTPAHTQPEPADNTSDYVKAGVRTWHQTGELIHPELAREIAAWFHSPSAHDRGLAAFASTGELLARDWSEDEVPELTPEERWRPIILDEIERELRGDEHDSYNVSYLCALRDYVQAACREVNRPY